MMNRCFTSVLLLAGLLGFATSAVAADGDGATYKVTVTNLLHGTPASNAASSTLQIPLIKAPGTVQGTFIGTACTDGMGNPRAGEMLGLWVFATHNASFKLFTLGQPARRELALLSQTGRPFFLRDALAATHGVGQVFSVPPSFPPTVPLTDVVLCPGKSITVTVNAQGNNRYLSLAAMIFPTNDGFIAVNGVRLPDGNDTLEIYSPAYDSGSEENDELCPNIPSLTFAGFPFPSNSSATGLSTCPNGLGPDNDVNSDPTNPSSPDNNPLRAEGNVHIHPGIRGVGDLDPAVFNWENPVAKITIKRIN
jgi:Spondin_N